MTKKKDNKKRMLVNAVHPEECRVAIVAGDELENIYIATASRQQSKGNIYKGVVMRVEPGLQAAFVEFDKGQKNGFLQFREIRPDYYKPKAKTSGEIGTAETVTSEDKTGKTANKSSNTANKGGTVAARQKIQDVISKKQEMLVQVDSDARDLKGASLTTHISLAGRYMVMMPGQERLGISRRIEKAKDRDNIRKIFSKLDPPKDAGFIVRTSGLDQSEATLKADLDYLVGRWEEIKKKAEKAKAPCLIHQEEDVVIRAIRDHLTDDVDEILIDDRDVSRRVKEYFKHHIPKYQKRVKLHRDKRPLFFKFAVEDKLELIHDRQVPLPSGGSIVIDTTEALTAIDVNSGKTRGEKDIEDLALRTNLEALQEIARHLRLRDLGGLIVIDFIDMRPAKNRKTVEEKLREALKKDKAKIDISRISKFGLLEMSRERLRPSFHAHNYVACPVCNGMGRYRAPEFLALAVLRELQEVLENEENLLGASARLPVDAANYLLNNKRQELLDLEKRAGKPVLVVAADDVPPGSYKLVVEREGQQAEDKERAASKTEDAAPKNKRKRRQKKKRRTEPVEDGESRESKAEKEEKPKESAEREPERPEKPDKQAATVPEKRKRKRTRRKPKVADTAVAEKASEPEAT